jgi:hypothetical protein
MFEKLFIHHRECQVVICKRCQFAVNPASVKGYIQSKHKTVTKEQYTRVIAFIGGLSQVAWDPEQVKYPDASSPAIPGIPVYTNGLRCVFETEGLTTMRKGIQYWCPVSTNHSKDGWALVATQALDRIRCKQRARTRPANIAG